MTLEKALNKYYTLDEYYKCNKERLIKFYTKHKKISNKDEYAREMFEAHIKTLMKGNNIDVKGAIKLFEQRVEFIYISYCLHIFLCKDKSKLKYIGRKKVQSRVKPHYEYIYTDGNDYYRSCEFLELRYNNISDEFCLN